MIFARSQVWGTLKRYLMYTTAGFVVLGGMGAAWSHRPAAVDSAAADPFDGTRLAEQFVQIAALDAPIWTQRVVSDLRPSDSSVTVLAADQPPAAATSKPAPAVQPQVHTARADEGVTQQVIAAASQPATEASSAPVIAQTRVARQHTPSIAKAAGAAPFTARIFQVAEFNAPNITVPPYVNLAPVDDAPVELAALDSDERGSGMPFGFAWGASETAMADDLDQDIQKVIEVRPGDTLYGVLVDAGVSEDEAKDAVGALSDVFSPRDLRAGQEITLNISTASGMRDSSTDPQLMSLTFEPDVVTDVTLKRSDSGNFVAASVDKELVDANRRVAGVIDSSLFGAAQEAGVPMPVIADLIKTFSFDVDFQRDIQDGDSFEVFYERKETAEGNFVKSGQILFASLTLSGKTIPVYYFERDGDGEYFTPNGEAIRKSLLRTPVDGARITSGFGMRMHPLLGYSKMHKGVDFGAPTGTPIYAAGSGTVVEITKNKSYGNYVRIRHNGEYQTAYAHMSKFAKGLKKGDRVKQGDVIGYVGATGRATGPHLHYEILVGGEQVNPAKVKMASGDKLTGKQLKAFEAQMAKIDAERKRQADQQLIAETPDSLDRSCGIDAGCQN